MPKASSLRKIRASRSGSPAPHGWSWDLKQSGKKGTVSRDTNRHHSGQASLKLEPNGKNVAEDPLAVTQIIPAGQFRGKKVEFSGYMMTEGGTQGILGMLAIVHGAAGKPDMLFQNAGGNGDWVEQRKVFNVPDDPSVLLVLICMSNGKSGASWFDDLSVTEVSGNSSQRQPTQSQPASGTPLKASVSVDASNVLREIPRPSTVRTSSGAGMR